AGRTSIAFARFFEEAVFPPGVVSVVTVLGPEAGDALVRHPDGGKVPFTGETATARIITARSADTLKRLAFELGGKSANVVFADADLDAAARGAAAAVFTGGAGQTCVAGSRLLVERRIYDEFLARVAKVAGEIQLGDPLDPRTGMGPVAFERQVEKVLSYLELGR